MLNKDISVIIPVYMVENYICKCLESLLSQSFDNFEVIIVDDESPDQSITKAKALVNSDDRFHFFSKKNGGLSDARNFGITKARGRYVTFLDSDDYYHVDFLLKMLDKIEKNDADIVICDVDLVNEKYQFIRRQKNTHSKSITGAEAMLDPTILNMAQNKLFKKELFKDVKYPIGYFYEDRATTYKLFYNSTKISFINESLFYYLQRENSITRGINNKKINDPLLILKEVKNFLQINAIYENYEIKYVQNYMLAILSTSVQIANYSDDYKMEIKRYINSLENNIFSMRNIFRTHNRKKICALILLKFSLFWFKKLAILEKKLS